MNRPLNSSSNPNSHQFAMRGARPMLFIVLVLAVSSPLYLFTGGGVPEASTPVVTASSQSAPRTTKQLRDAYGQLPLSFEANRGQADEAVNFLSRGAGYTLSLSPTEAVFALTRHSDKQSPGDGAAPNRRDESGAATRAERDTGTSNASRSESSSSAVLRMNLVGASGESKVEGLNELEGKVNYLIGNDPAKWRTNIPTFGRVRYAEVYPGIDVVYYGNQKQLEYDFVVAPGHEAHALKLRFEGADKVLVDATGDLLLTIGEGTMRQPKPVLYQEVAGERRAVDGGYVVGADGLVGFTVGEYDARQTLVIDPVLSYSTYLGGNDTDEGNDIAVDSSGNAYICGVTNSTNFPTANPIQGTFSPPLDPTLVSRDGFVTKLNAAGTALVYSTYLGGNRDDLCNKIAVDASGNAYLAGETGSSNFPTANAVQSTFGGGLKDAFIAKLNPAGSAFVYSTYLGGTIFDAAQAIAIDSTGSVYITGRSTSSDYPVVNPIQSAYSGGPGADVIVTKLNPAGSALVYSTYLGGNGGNGFEAGFSIKVDSTGNAYVTGQTSSTNFPTANPIQATFGGGFPDGDAFVTKINAAGSALVYSTYLGGSDNDIGFEIALDSTGNAHVAGVTRSANFPAANAFQSTLKGTSDAFVTKLNAAGSAFIYSTYLGGTTDDSANGIALDSAGNVYVAGGTSSTDFPLVNPIQGTMAGVFDVFLTKLNTAGTALTYSTYLGGSGGDTALAVVVDSAGSMYMTGRTASTNYPTLNPVQSANGGGSTDTFVTKISDPPPPPATFTISGQITLSGSGLSGVTVTLSGSQGATTTTDASGNYSFTNLTAGGNYTVTPTKTDNTFNPPSATFNNLSANQTANFTATATPTTVQFSSSSLNVQEDCTGIQLNITRTGPTTGTTVVDYATADGTAQQKADYTIALGRLTFAPNETSKTITLLISEDSFVEGTETFTVGLSNITGGSPGTPSTATIQILDDATEPATNAIDNSTNFVCQHYHDFLNRQPDDVGFPGWLNILANCQQGDVHCDRIEVSSAFYRSDEFQMRGFFLYSFYAAALGRVPQYREFMMDLSRTTGFLTAQQVEAGKVAFIQDFTARQEFKNKYDSLTDPAAYVNALEQTAQVTLANKQQLITDLQMGTKTRAEVLRAVAESPEVTAKYYNQAFVVMEYFGYLRRDPDILYLNWIQTLNQTGSYRTLVSGFINSQEYRQRFGSQ